MQYGALIVATRRRHADWAGKLVRKLKDLLGGRAEAPVQVRERLRLDAVDVPIYAIGDVHGCLDKLLRLEEKIVADAAALPGRKILVMLGDYVDRGPASAQVLAHLSEPPPDGFDRIALAGNHETVMLDYLEGKVRLGQWVGIGGDATLRSYDIDLPRMRSIYGSQNEIDAAIRSAIPASDVALLRALPILVDTPGFTFVHAGIRPGIPLEQQSDEDLVWIRDEFYDRADLLSKTLVHGHTPVSVPQLDGRRLNIDTGAFLGRPLTAVRVWQGQGMFLQS